uniref:GAG-pre-integrase domain-containing protein n=1 Tax=Tanacetum cinerariifolium TaxID=118510 RepID=A0A6L2K2Z0_TANCI|nr:hypothetical protein [Tanacetum cinerariifolium]
MNDIKRNKHFPENIAENLKFLNNLQPEWKRHDTIVHQTKNLHETDFTQIYDFLKMNQDEVNELRAERLAKTHDPLALMAHSQNSYKFAATHNDQSTSSIHSQQSFPINNKYNPLPSLNHNFMQPPMTFLEDINDPTEAINAALMLFAKAFQLTEPTNNNQRTSSNPRNCQIAKPNQQGYNAWQNGGTQVAQNAVQNAGVQSEGNQKGLVVVPGIANQNGTGNVVAARAKGNGNGNQARCYNYRGLGHIARNCTARPRRRDATYLQTQLLSAQKEEEGIQLQAGEFDFMVAASDLDEIEEVNTDCILMANLQHASTSGTQLDKALVYDTNGSAENDNHVTFVAPVMVQSGGIVETSSAPNEEIRAHQEIVYRNLVDQVAQEKSSISSLMEEKKKLKHDVKTQEDKFLDKEVDLEAKIKDLENILLKRDQTEELFLSSVLNMVTISKTISIPNEDLSDDITPSVARKFLNEVKSSLVTLQRVVKQKMTLVQNFKIQFLQEAAKFIRDFKSLVKEADESLNKQKYLELEIKRLLKASVSHDIMYIVQNGFVDVPSDLRTELDRTKEKLELCIIKKEKEYAVLWNNWYTKCEECKYDKISYDKAYNGMQQKVERLHAQLRDLKELEFQVVNYEREISHLRTTYKNLFDSITSNWAHAKLHNLIYENAQLRARVFKNTSESINNTTGTRVTPHVDKPKLSAVTLHSKKLHASMPSHSVPQPREFNVMNHRNVIAFRMFNINLSQTFKVDLVPNKQSSASIRTNPITNSQCHVTFKENVSSDTVTASSTGRNTCFIRDLDGVDLLKCNRSTNLYTNNLYDMASTSPICLMAHATPTKSWLWHQRLSHLNFETINNLAKNDLVFGLPKFKYAKEHLCPSYDYSRYTWVYFLRPKDETPEVIKNFLKKIYVRLQAPVIIVRKEYFDSVGITHETSAAKTPQQNGVVESRNHTLVEAARTIVYYQRTKKIMEMMNVTFEELSAMAFEQNSSRPRLQCITSGQISSELELTYAPSTITPQRPSECDLDILFEPLHNEYLGGRPSEAPRTIPAAPVVQNL